MNRFEQEIEFTNIVSKMEQTLLRKGNDYSTTDRLSNFKMAGAISGLKPEVQCLSLISTKVARLGVLLNSDKEPNNESVQDSVLDLANYSILLSMILTDKEKESKIQKKYNSIDLC